MPKIGFVGLGHMGNPMVRRLLAKHEVTVFDVVPEAMQALGLHGAKPASKLADVVNDVDVVITMLQTGEQVKSVYLQAEGLFSFAGKHTIFIDSSTIDIASTLALHQKAQQQGFALLDAPVSGGVLGAENGSLTFMVGGEIQTFERAKTLLYCMGENIIHAGKASNGQAAKICNNMLLGISMIGVSEAFHLADKLGLDKQIFFEIASNASGQCWSLTSYAPVPEVVPSSPANRDYQPGFSTNMMLKDLNLSQDAAQHVGAYTPMGQKACKLYSTFTEAGNGELDFSAIIKLLNSD